MGSINKHEVEVNHALVNSLFRYNLGRLYWKDSPAKAVKKGAIAGYDHPKGYRYVKIKSKPYAEHRIIFLLHKGYFPIQVDHINNIRSDNNIENLRECTNAQNQQNQKLCKNNTSGVKGVSWSKKSKKWVACIYMNGKNKSLGYFSDIELARKKVMTFRKSLHKEFANHG